MADYSVTFARSARKEVEVLSKSLVERIISKIDALGENPRRPGCRKLRGYINLWRIRVGDYRIIYSVYDEREDVDIVAIRHRSEAYD